MIKKKTEKVFSNKEDSISKKISVFLKSERTHFVIGILCVMFGVYLFIAFLSFFYTGNADQSKLENLPLSELSSIKNEIRNWTGAFGAYLSDLLINQWVGISAFFISFFIAKVGLKLMKVKNFSITKSLVYTCSLIILGSLICGFFFIDNYKDSYLFLGGYHGYYMTLLLQANIGWTGTLLFILTGVLIFLVAISAKTVPFLRKIFLLDIKRKKDIEVSESEDNKIYQTSLENKNLVNKLISISEVLNSDIEDEPDMVESGGCTDKTDHHEENFFEIVPKQEETLVKEDTIQEDRSGEPEFVIEENVQEEEEISNSEELGEYDPTLDLSRYKAPSFDLLNKYEGNDRQIDMNEQNANKNRIIETLENYGIRISSIKATVGPTITLYEIVPEPGVRISKIRNLEDDIALSLAALGIRIIAPIPGKGTIGIEVPNKDPQIVSMYSVIASKKFQECKFDLPVALGKTITNEIFMVDLAKMPHILVAGATGQGKSVGLNAIITSLLYKKHPAQLKFVLIDPKKVEFNIYANIERHFLAKLPDGDEAIITDVTKVVQTLNSITKEMDDRYDLLKKAHTRNIKEYNSKFIARRLNPNNGHRYMPYIVVIVDEFGDLIMTAGKEVELPIARIAQLARAVGIHMIIATQRPSTNIITGVIKANFPARIAFKVSSMIDSRTILDCPGANQLIGRGDLLFSQGSDLIRVQSAFVDTPEVEKICEYIGDQESYPTAYLLPEYVGENGESGLTDVNLKDRDPMFEEAARLIVANQQGSTSLIQRKFSIGYNRAGRIMDQLEAAGIVGPFEGSKARQVLVIDDIHLEQIFESLK
ncbi:FtsK/SpoIIIE family DNA translocase [Coprobacter fastidiosus]|uniref:FtsK/SpoIIIE family DNA translocase n=1 Tax=Coprobacter fastidiosus TaxID=1099853 RepID=UPI0032099BF4